MKKIIVFQNGIETLSYFSKQLALAFEKMGHKVFYFDLEREKAKLDALVETKISIEKYMKKLKHQGE